MPVVIDLGVYDLVIGDVTTADEYLHYLFERPVL